MINKFWYLTKVSLKRKIKNKWFLIANIIIALAIIAVFNIDLIINYFGGDFDDKTKIYVVDNTLISYDVFSNNLTAGLEQYGLDNYDVTLSNNTKEELVEMISSDEKEANSIVLVFNNSDDIMDVEMISNDFVDTISMSLINMSVNSTKVYLAVLKYNIGEDELNALTGSVEIQRTILDETKDSTEENMTAIMTTVFPIFILPFFMLVIFLVQMIGAEVNDEKTTRGMEIIISNVSAKTHFFSKCAAGNMFVLFQAFLLICYLALAILVRSFINVSSITSITNQAAGLLSGILSTSFIASLKYVIPLILILMILNFVAYSLLAGVLASMTTNAEDFQQLQTPIIFCLLIGYYLAIMAGTFKGSLLIKIFGYIPFISAILSPSLLVMGEFSVIDITISILLTIGVIYILIKYGLRIYKIGILNYSSGNLWKKMFKALKEK